MPLWSTISPISSEMPNVGMLNSSTTHWCWMCSLHFQMILLWQVGGIEFQCHLALFGISNQDWIEMIASSESKWSMNGSMLNWGEKQMRHKERRSVWCGGQSGQGEDRWWWWLSVEWNQQVKIQVKESWWGLRSVVPVEQPKHADQCQNVGKMSELKWRHSKLRLRTALIIAPSRGGALKTKGHTAQIEVLTGQSRLKSADSD